MVHELFNEDLGILPRQLKGPYGSQQLLARSADRMWSSQLRAVVTIAPLYGSSAIRSCGNMLNTHNRSLRTLVSFPLFAAEHLSGDRSWQNCFLLDETASRQSYSYKKTPLLTYWYAWVEAQPLWKRCLKSLINLTQLVSTRHQQHAGNAGGAEWNLFIIASN